MDEDTLTAETSEYVSGMMSPLRWRAYEHEHIERGSDWYWALGIAATCMALTTLLFGNLLFGFVIILAAVILGLLANRPPQLSEFEISDRGIRINTDTHRYEEILAFWVDHEEGRPPMLLLDTPKFMAPNLIIPIVDVDPNEVRAYLLERVVEVPMKEPLAHKILEFIGL